MLTPSDQDPGNLLFNSPLNLLFNTVLELVGKSVRQERSPSENAEYCMFPTIGHSGRDRPMQLKKRGATVARGCINMSSSSLSSSRTVDQNPLYWECRVIASRPPEKPQIPCAPTEKILHASTKIQGSEINKYFSQLSMGSSMVTNGPHLQDTEIGMMGEGSMETLHTFYSVFL